MNNLVFQTAFIGDTLLTIPLLKNLRKVDPETPIVLFARKSLQSFFESSGLVDKFVVADKSNRREWKKSVEALRALEFKDVFCVHESLRSALAIRSLRTQRVVGYARWWNSLFFSKRVVRPMHLPEALRQLALLAAVNSDFRVVFNKWILANRAQAPQSQETLPLRVPGSPEEFLLSLDGTTGSPRDGKMIGLAPGSVWNTKKWPAQSYAELAEILLRRGYKVVLFGSEEERQDCLLIEMHLRHKFSVDQVSQHFENRCGQGNLAAAFTGMRALDVLVSNDSGLMHLAAAAGTPNVAIFGPTTLDLGYQPWNPSAVVVQKPLPCRPCGRHGHQKCPIGTHECMKAIGPEEVFQSVRRLLTL